MNCSAIITKVCRAVDSRRPKDLMIPTEAATTGSDEGISAF